MEFLFYYHYFSGWLLKYIYHFYLFIYFCIIFLHTNLPYFVKRPRAIVIDWALYKYFYYYYYYYYLRQIAYRIIIICTVRNYKWKLQPSYAPDKIYNASAFLTGNYKCVITDSDYSIVYKVVNSLKLKTSL